MVKVEILQQKGYNFLWIDDYLWMWDIPAERKEQKKMADKAYGKVLVAGYGLGLVQEYLTKNPKVKSVLSVEEIKAVIDKVEKIYGKIYGKVKIGDFYELPENEKFDCVIGDICEDAVFGALGEYKKFKNKARKLVKPEGKILAWQQEFFEYLLKNNPDNLKPVKHIDVKKGMKASELIEEMEKSGVFGAGKMARAAEIFKEMIKDKECRVFFGLAGAMVPGGMKNIIIDMLKEGYIDVFVTTGANLTHDLIEALGFKHYQGKANVDDAELRVKNIDRIYDSYLRDKVYEKLEDFFIRLFPKFPEKMNIKEFLWEIGKHIKDENSILRVCYEKKIPIFCPAIADSGIGLMVWGRLIEGIDVEKKLSKESRIRVDTFDDMREIMELAWASKKRGVFYVGGGMPKNFIQQALQFSTKQQGADYGIQITMDRPEHGGSSGAPLKEGISWGKMKKDAKFVNVICDATIALPLIYAAVKDKIE